MMFSVKLDTMNILFLPKLSDAFHGWQFERQKVVLLFICAYSAGKSNLQSDAAAVWQGRGLKLLC